MHFDFLVMNGLSNNSCKVRKICTSQVVFGALVIFASLLISPVIRCSRQINFICQYPLEEQYKNALVNIEVDNKHPFLVALGCNKEVHLKPRDKQDYIYLPGDFVNATDFDLLLEIEAPDFFDVDRKLIIPRRQWEHFSIGLDCKMGNKQDASVKIFNGQTKELLCEIFVDY